MKKLTLTLFALTLPCAPLTAQAVPDNSQASKLATGLRRSPLFGVDPFQNAMIPRFGLVTSVGVSAENNAYSLRDFGAMQFLSDQPDGLGLGHAIDVISLIPAGEGLTAAVEGEVSQYLGLSFGRLLTLGFSAGVRSYGSMTADDRIVTLFRDGNVTNSQFSFGQSNALNLTTADAGVHAVMRFGPVGTIDGVHVSAGAGARLVRPLFLVSAQSAIQGGGSFSVTTDSIRTNVGFQILSSFPLDSTDNLRTYIEDRARGNVGTGARSILADLLLRLEWPTSGVAVEGMLINVGSPLMIEQVGRGIDTLLVQTANLDSLRTAVDSLDFSIRDSMDVEVALPQIWRLTASAWANAILQLDVSASGSASGDIEVPTQVALGSTWRFVRQLPLRAGVILGGSQAMGFAGGFGIEGRNFILRVNAQTLGGLFENAKGLGAKLDFGFFF